MDLHSLMQQFSSRVDAALHKFIAAQQGPNTQLNAAIEYSLLNGGKRLRPFLVYATGQALGASLSACDRPAMAVELIHAYSLVHDDLPAMDDDDLRRGRPTCHKAFDEATAILVGDALQALAFQVLASPEQTSALELMACLAQASGPQGMVAGQAIDLSSEGKSLNLEQLKELHNHKTGALIRASVKMGALAAAASPQQLALLDSYAQALGLAFQVQDDLLDVQGDALTLGKNTGTDAKLNKATYPSLLGLEGASRHAQELSLQAKTSLKQLAAEQLVTKQLTERKQQEGQLQDSFSYLEQLADWSISREF